MQILEQIKQKDRIEVIKLPHTHTHSIIRRNCGETRVILFYSNNNTGEQLIMHYLHNLYENEKL